MLPRLLQKTACVDAVCRSPGYPPTLQGTYAARTQNGPQSCPPTITPLPPLMPPAPSTLRRHSGRVRLWVSDASNIACRGRCGIWFVNTCGRARTGALARQH